MSIDALNSLPGSEAAKLDGAPVQYSEAFHEALPRRVGYIVRKNEAGRFGFIRSDGYDYFFHKNNLATNVDFDTLAIDTAVEFLAVNRQKDRNQSGNSNFMDKAIRVRLADRHTHNFNR